MLRQARATGGNQVREISCCSRDLLLEISWRSRTTSCSELPVNTSIGPSEIHTRMRQMSAILPPYDARCLGNWAMNMNLQAYADPRGLPASKATRVAGLLAIDREEIVSDVQLARCVSSGLLSRAAIALAEILGRNRVVGPVVSEATLRRVRKANRPMSREHSEPKSASYGFGTGSEEILARIARTSRVIRIPSPRAIAGA